MDVATLEERMNNCFKLTPVDPHLLKGEDKQLICSYRRCLVLQVH